MTSSLSKQRDAQTMGQPKTVSFSEVSIIEFAYAVGNAPCSAGVPIGASSEAQHQTTFPLDFFESHRPQRRNKTDLHISAQDRKSL